MFLFRHHEDLTCCDYTSKTQRIQQIVIITENQEG